MPILLATGHLAAVDAWREPPLVRLRQAPAGLEGPWRIRARVVEAPRPTRGGAAFRIRAQRLFRHGAWGSTDGVVEVSLPAMPERTLASGSRIETFLRLRNDRPPANPGLPTRDRLGVRGIDLRARLKSDRQIRRLSPAPPMSIHVSDLRAAIRRRLEARLERSGAALALALGERGGIDDASMIRLARSGLVHLFAISGLHVGLVAMAAIALARMAGVPPRAATLGGALAAVGTSLLVAPAAPVRRAAVMTLALCAGALHGRRHSAASALALSLLLLAWLEPRGVHAPGFQMSALATAGLVATLTRTDGSGVAMKPVRLLAATAVAQAWVAPVIAATGAPVPLAALVLNLLALPLLCGALAGIGLTLLTAGWLEAAAAGAARSTDLALVGLEALAALGAATPALPLHFSVATAIVWWGGLLLAARAAASGLRRLAAVAAGGALLWAALPPPPPSAPRLDLLDVGQGDAIRLHTAPGELLMDAGGYPGLDYDVGAHLVLPALRRLGVDGLERAALSHAHADHAAGLPSVVEALGAREIWLGVHPPSDGRVAALRAAAPSATTLVPGRAWRRHGGCDLRALTPPEPLRRTGIRRVDNEASLVLVARCGAVDLWLVGDAGAPAERFWDPETGRRSLLKVGHHGSSSATSAAFLDRLRPRHALISVGARNAFGLPRVEVLQRIRERGIALYRTDRDGALSVEIDGRVRIRGERWSAG